MARGPLASGADDDVPQGPASPIRWLVLLGVWLVYATFGMTTVSLAPLVATITADLGITHGAMGVVFGAWQLMFIASAVPSGRLMDRLGTGYGLFLGAVSVALSGLLRSWSVDFWTLVAAVSVLGIGGPLISTGAPKVVARWFQGQQRGLAMGIYITGPALGSILSLSMTNSFLMPALGGDWRAVSRVWAAIAIAAGIAWLVIAHLPAIRQADVSARAGHASAKRATLSELLSVHAVRLLLMMSVGIFLFNHGLNNWLPEVLRSKGMTPVAAGYWATVPTLVGLAGSLVIPRLATPQRRHAMLGGLFAAGLLASLLLRVDEGPLLMLGLAMQGIARSSMMTVAMLTLVETPGIGERNAATASGLFFSAAEVGGASGPLVLGIVHDLTGGFGACLALLSAVMAILIAASVHLRRISRPPVPAIQT
ncbi:MAG: MFS transporter [Hyphomicrobiaceae bacterium]